MSITSLQKPLFGLALAGFLFSVTFFCHFFSMSDHAEMNAKLSQPVSFSANSAPCCYSEVSLQMFLDKISTTQPLNQALLNIIVGVISLAGLIYALDLWDSRERSRYQYYRDKNLLSRFHNYILQFLSRGILQPRVYNA